MPTQIQEVTGEIVPERAPAADTHAVAPANEDEVHEKLRIELALRLERRARLFAD
jgi:hypothetical protein